LTKNEQFEKRFFEILKFFQNQGSVPKLGFLFFHPDWVSEHIPKVDNRKISIADSNNFAAMAPTA
jgi:hypothetical protein